MSVQTQMVLHLAIAKKCDPGLSERFNLFTKQREHSQASESDQSGEGAKDLVSIVEFQVNECLHQIVRRGLHSSSTQWLHDMKL